MVSPRPVSQLAEKEKEEEKEKHVRNVTQGCPVAFTCTETPMHAHLHTQTHQDCPVAFTCTHTHLMRLKIVERLLLL